MGFTRAKREGDDTEAINKLFAPEFRNRLDAVISFSHLPAEVIQKVVDKFVMQLEAQLADRNVTIELTDESRDWLVEHGYDEAMGARPMARLIQTTIKTPLADDVLFGRLKEGGAVRVVVKTDEIGLKSLGFEYPEGPVIPKPEKDVSNAAKKRSKPKSKAYSKPKKAAKPKGGGDKGGGVRTVPKVPLVRA
jgi:ATP-dependent Clp protease ATP-binding subunit ClpA